MLIPTVLYQVLADFSDPHQKPLEVELISWASNCILHRAVVAAATLTLETVSVYQSVLKPCAPHLQFMDTEKYDTFMKWNK